MAVLRYSTTGKAMEMLGEGGAAGVSRDRF